MSSVNAKGSVVELSETAGVVVGGGAVVVLAVVVWNTAQHG